MWGAPATVKDLFAESLILIMLSSSEWSLEWSNPSSWQCSKVPALVTASEGTELLWFLTVSPSPHSPCAKGSSTLGSGMGLALVFISPLNLTFNEIIHHLITACRNSHLLVHPTTYQPFILHFIFVIPLCNPGRVNTALGVSSSRDWGTLGVFSSWKTSSLPKAMQTQTRWSNEAFAVWVGPLWKDFSLFAYFGTLQRSFSCYWNLEV